MFGFHAVPEGELCRILILLLCGGAKWMDWHYVWVDQLILGLDNSSVAGLYRDVVVRL